MKETELKEVMNEVVKEIYEEAYTNLRLSHEYYRDYIDSELKDNAARITAYEYKERAYEDLGLIAKFTSEDYEELLAKMPWPLSYDVEIKKWWE